MKIVLKRRRFQCVEEIKKNVTAEANEVPSKVFGDCFVQLLKKFKCCVAVTGYCIERKQVIFFLFQCIRASEIYCLTSQYSIVSNNLPSFEMCFN
jgi:hypothetical protein